LLHRLLTLTALSFVLASLTADHLISQATDTDSDLQPAVTADQRAWARDLMRQAEEGNLEAQFELSKAYLNGVVFKQNPRAAVTWTRGSSGTC